MLLNIYKIFLFTLFSHYNNLRWNPSWTNQSPFNEESNDWRHVNILRERHSCFVKVNRFVDRERADNSGPPYGRVVSRWAVICMRPADISTPACSLVCLVVSSSPCRFLEATIFWRETTTLSAKEEIRKRRRLRRSKEEK